MVKAKNFIKICLFMKDNFIKMKNMEKENYFLKILVIMKVIFILIYPKVMVFIFRIKKKILNLSLYNNQKNTKKYHPFRY